MFCIVALMIHVKHADENITLDYMSLGSSWENHNRNKYRNINLCCIYETLSVKCWLLLTNNHLLLDSCWYAFCHTVQNWTAFKDNLPPCTEVLSHRRSRARCILLVRTGFDSSPSSRIFSGQASLYCLRWLDGAHVCLLQDLLWDAASHYRLDPDFSYECTRSSQDVGLQHILNYFIDH